MGCFYGSLPSQAQTRRRRNQLVSGAVYRHAGELSSHAPGVTRWCHFRDYVPFELFPFDLSGKKSGRPRASKRCCEPGTWIAKPVERVS